jgi:hypothetical protein
MAAADRRAVDGHCPSPGNHAATLFVVQDFSSIKHRLEIVRDELFRLR